MYSNMCISDMNIMHIDIDISCDITCIYTFICTYCSHACMYCAHVHAENYAVWCGLVMPPGIMGNNFGVSVELEELEEANTRQLQSSFAPREFSEL